MRGVVLAVGLALAFAAGAGKAGAQGMAEIRFDSIEFDSIDGGAMGADWAGRPVLVANTASLCGYTPQYAELQALHDAYKDRGLVVVAVPSDSFNQELGSDEEVRDFCQLNYGLDLPMAKTTAVRGEDAHPFYARLREEAGWEPRWNFNKVLVGADGAVLGTWGSGASPTGPEIRAAVEAALASSGAPSGASGS